MVIVAQKGSADAGSPEAQWRPGTFAAELDPNAADEVDLIVIAETSRKVALVTGAGRGIGRAIAVKLAEQGMDVALHVHRSVVEAHDVVAAITALGRRAVTIQADLQRLDNVPTVVDETLASFGQLDVLVNNAGVYNTTSFDKVTPQLWESTFAVNLRAVFFLCQAAVPALRASGNGTIVNLASGGGLSARPGFPVSVPYAASKAGVVMLTRVLALELAPSIRVNAVAPGIIASKPRKMSAATREKFAAITPLRRVGEPTDVADAVAFLVSDEARFITGQTLSVDGGLVMH